MSDSTRKYYLDNFRGFQNTLIELRDVNFLVGENSSGKTSIAETIALLSGQQFWFQMEFGAAQGLSNLFSDLVSKSSGRKDYFTLGQLMGRENALCYLMTFTNNHGLPRLKILSVIADGAVSTVVATGTRTALLSERPISSKRDTVMLTEVSGLHNELVSGTIADMRAMREFEERKLDWDYIGNVTNFFRLSAFIADSREKKDKKGNRRRRYIGLPGMFFGDGMIVIAPIRSKVKRTYDEFKTEYSAEGAHTPYLIRENLLSRAKRRRFNAFLTRFGKSSGLFNRVQVTPYSQDPVSPFELDVQIGKEMFPINSVGYGVSQALPIVVECFLRPKGSWFAIQQPEVHLHPRAQAAFGEAIFDVASKEDKKFVIETHSDYIIDRFRLQLGKSSAKRKLTAQVLFFEHSRSGFNKIHAIQIDNSGNLSSAQPKSYRRFFVREQLGLLGL